MSNAGDIRRQVERESEWRRRLAVPAFAGGFLYLLSAIVIATAVNGAPKVGLLQGLEPALSGVAHPAVSPQAAEVKFISHHAFDLIAGSVLAALALAALTLILLALVEATRFRRPESWPAARPLVIGGGAAFAVVSVANQIVAAILTHKFAVGHDFSYAAVENALTKGTAHMIVQYLALLAGLALAAGMIGTMINALRVGLVPRWMGYLGMFTALLIFLPIGGATLQLVPAFWLVMMGILYAGRWPGGEPPAWAAGEARPWPSGAQVRAARQQAASETASEPAAVAAGTPAPSAPAGAASSRRRRKRGGRR